MNQTTIFDKAFESSIAVTRWSLLSVWIRIYLGIEALLGAILIGCMGYFSYYGTLRSGKNELIWAENMAHVAMSLWAISYFCKPLLIWLEFKWAIRYNWVADIVYIILGILCFIMGANWMITIGMWVLLSLPDWYLVFRIRRRWQNEAISRRQLKAMNHLSP